MKKYFFLVTATTFLLTGFNLAQAEESIITGKSILPGCKMLAAGNIGNSWRDLDDDATRQFWMCAAAVEATNQVMLKYSKGCIPDNIQTKDIINVVIQYMEAHSDSLNKGFGFLIAEALQKKWPCTK